MTKITRDERKEPIRNNQNKKRSMTSATNRHSSTISSWSSASCRETRIFKCLVIRSPFCSPPRPLQPPPLSDAIFKALVEAIVPLQLAGSVVQVLSTYVVRHMSSRGMLSVMVYLRQGSRRPCVETHTRRARKLKLRIFSHLATGFCCGPTWCS